MVVSLISFKNKGRIKKVVLSGIGSHSDLVKDNIKKLKRAGWKDSANGENIISIESNFSGWNRFTVESGEPSKSELAILKRAYKKCAGSAKVLIAHVKRCGKIDDALIKLFTAPAQNVLNETTAPAQKVFNETYASAQKVFNETTASAWIKLFTVKLNRASHLQ